MIRRSLYSGTYQLKHEVDLLLSEHYIRYMQVLGIAHRHTRPNHTEFGKLVNV